MADEISEHSPEGDVTFAAQGAANLDYYVKRFTEVRNKSDVTQTDFWVCLVFDSPEQKNEFLARTGLGAKDASYIDGADVARKLGVELTPVDLSISKRVSDYDALAMEIQS